MGGEMLMFTDHKPEIIVVDGFYSDPDAMRKLALEQEFFESQYHKGKRTRKQFLFPGLKERFEDLLRRKITNWEPHAMNGVFQYCVAGDALVIHSDFQSHAAAIYLTPNAPPETGTSFYRSKAYPFDRAPTEEMAAKLGKTAAEVEQGMYYGKLFDFTAWDLVDTIGNVYNRLTLWNGRKVHSASNYFGHTKETGRLFQIFFFDAE
jgi:uncharacterized protein DUF6445